MSTVTIGDIDVAYTEAGAGPPVVLIHGLAEARATWDVQQRDLAPVHTYAYDLRGHGETTLGDADGTLEQLGGDLVGFLEQVTGQATVVGFSLGGTIALWAAAERPDLVQRVIVFGTSSVVGRAAASFYDQRISDASDTSSPVFRAALREDTAAAIVTATDRVEEILSARLAAVGDGRGYVNAARAMASLHDAPLTGRLDDVKVHVDVVGASGDTFCPEKAARILMDGLPDAAYFEVRGAGHLVNVDNPHGVTEILRTALAERSEQ